MRNLLLGVVLLFLSGFIQAGEFVEGRDFEVIPAVPGYENTVLEFFSYDCGYCYRAEDVIAIFKNSLPEDISFQRTPVIFGKSNYKVKAYAWFLLDELNLGEDVHRYIFDVSQVPMGVEWELGQLRYMENIKEFYLKVGAGVITEEKYEKALESIDKKDLIAKANELSMKYKVSGTPTFIVKGRYKIMGLQPSPKGKEYLADLLYFLINKDDASISAM